MPKEILLIDDDTDELEIFTDALNAVDKTIRCTQTRNLNEALQYLRNNSPGYIFIDFNMPKYNGVECLAELKKLTSLANSKIILYSNHIDDEMSQKAIDLGAHLCIKKPSMINVLARRLKEVLNADQVS
ncbi:MAG TPA: response regulator [Chitinophagaceae bacterium]|nr:response regulator [Chitinophagaceae bacterium]